MCAAERAGCAILQLPAVIFQAAYPVEQVNIFLGLADNLFAQFRFSGQGMLLMRKGTLLLPEGFHPQLQGCPLWGGLCNPRQGFQNRSQAVVASCQRFRFSSPGGKIAPLQQRFGRASDTRQPVFCI